MDISQDLIEQIAKDFFQIMPTLRKKVFKPFERKSDILSPMQVHVLLFLKDQKLRTMSELASEMNILKQQLTSLTDKLADYGYIQRIPDDIDRRSVKIAITPSGLDYLDKLRKESFQLLIKKFEKLPKEELQELHHAILTLQKIVESL